MKTVYKYKVELNGYTGLTLPLHAKFVYFGVQSFDHGNEMFVWFEVNPHELKVERSFRVAATGEYILEKDAVHLSTLQAGQYVWHLYEVI